MNTYSNHSVSAHKRKSETISHKLSGSPFAQFSKNTHSKLSRGTKSVESSKDLDALTALCKGITIQEKSSSTANVKLASYGSKPPITQAGQQQNAKASVPTLNISKLVDNPSNSRKTVAVTDHLHRRKSLNKSEEIKTVKVFQSDQQSGVISDLGLAIPCAPPATPTAGKLNLHVSHIA